MGPGLRNITCLLPLLLVGCRNDPVYPAESFFPRHLAVEADGSGVHFLQVTGFADGTLRIYRVNDADLTLEKVFWSGFGADPVGTSGAALINSELFSGAWDVAITADGQNSVVSGRLSHRVVRLTKEAGSWQIGATLRDGEAIPVDIPDQGMGTDVLGSDQVLALSQPRGLALAPDEGAVYVTGYAVHAIARLGLRGAGLVFDDSVSPIPSPHQLIVLPKAATSTLTGTGTVSSSIDDFLYVLGGDPTNCSGGNAHLLGLRWQDEDTQLLQQVTSADAIALCTDATDPQDCLRDDLEVPGLIGGFGLDWTQTASGAEYLFVSSACQGTVTAFERRSDDLLDYAGDYRVIAPWETASTTAEDGTVTTLTSTSASLAGLRDIEIYNGYVYTAASEGGFLAYFPIECVTSPSTLADLSVCAGVLCLDDVSACAVAPDGTGTTVAAHPWGLKAAEGILYVTLDLEGGIAVIDLAADGTPTVRFIVGG